MCKKQTSVSHSSTEFKIISLDAGLRIDGLPALGLVGRGDRSATFIEQYQITKKPSPQQETVCEIPKGIADLNPNKRETEM